MGHAFLRNLNSTIWQTTLLYDVRLVRSEPHIDLERLDMETFFDVIPFHIDSLLPTILDFIPVS